MDYQKITWEGYEGISFQFAGKTAKLIKPNCNPNGKWALKTEYFGAFPETEKLLLERGWHIAWNENANRWAQEEDLKRKAEFIKFVPQEFGLEEKCAMIGMSCGGLYAVKTTALCPESVSVLYLDAPVMNLLSCPAGLGVSECGLFGEFFRFTGISVSELIGYREHPIDKMDVLLKHNIPVILVAGDSDRTVPYCENGALLEKYYRENGGIIEVHIKPGGDHHPHGLENPAVIADFMEKF